MCRQLTYDPKCGQGYGAEVLAMVGNWSPVVKTRENPALGNAGSSATRHHHHGHTIILIMVTMSKGDSSKHIWANTAWDVSPGMAHSIPYTQPYGNDTSIDAHAIHTYLIFTAIMILNTTWIILWDGTYDYLWNITLGYNIIFFRFTKHTKRQ